MATDLRQFDSWHPWALDADRAIDLALPCDTAGRDCDAQIGNSDGASLGSGQSLIVFAHSPGFVRRHRLSAALRVCLACVCTFFSRSSTSPYILYFFFFFFLFFFFF